MTDRTAIPGTTSDQPTNEQTSEFINLIRELSLIRQKMLDLETLGLQKAGEIHPTYLQSARNLFHYLALRRHEMRPLQERLSALGLSSLGRTESHVLTSINKVLEALHRLAHIPQTELPAVAPINSFEEGRALLEHHTEALLGSPPEKRTARVMVTMPTEAADAPMLIERLLANGMNCMRINCAHDDAPVWKRMIEHLRQA